VTSSKPITDEFWLAHPVFLLHNHHNYHQQHKKEKVRLGLEKIKMSGIVHFIKKQTKGYTRQMQSISGYECMKKL